jgi:hypothetical protein
MDSAYLTAENKRLARHARYNTSAKGQARNRRYEEAHPERKLRWGAMEIQRRRLA